MWFEAWTTICLYGTSNACTIEPRLNPARICNCCYKVGVIIWWKQYICSAWVYYSILCVVLFQICVISRICNILVRECVHGYWPELSVAITEGLKRNISDCAIKKCCIRCTKLDERGYWTDIKRKANCVITNIATLKKVWGKGWWTLSCLWSKAKNTSKTIIGYTNFCSQKKVKLRSASWSSNIFTQTYSIANYASCEIVRSSNIGNLSCIIGSNAIESGTWTRIERISTQACTAAFTRDS